jgi:hypothetical protein
MAVRSATCGVGGSILKTCGLVSTFATVVTVHASLRAAEQEAKAANCQGAFLDTSVSRLARFRNDMVMNALASCTTIRQVTLTISCAKSLKI